jgi:hypothetical protein
MCRSRDTITVSLLSSYTCVYLILLFIFIPMNLSLNFHRISIDTHSAVAGKFSAMGGYIFHSYSIYVLNIIFYISILL